MLASLKVCTIISKLIISHFAFCVENNAQVIKDFFSLLFVFVLLHFLAVC